jgi:hypothetical protein
VYTSRLDNCALLPAGVDPCDERPLPELRVEAGDVPGEWYRDASPTCDFHWGECP